MHICVADGLEKLAKEYMIKFCLKNKIYPVNQSLVDFINRKICKNTNENEFEIDNKIWKIQVNNYTNMKPPFKRF